MERLLRDRVELHCGNMLDVLATLDENSLDSCVTDPPYHLTSIVKRFSNTTPERETFAMNNPVEAYGRLSRGFMGKLWDGGEIAFDPATWRAVFRVLKPGAHLVACGGTRTYHRMATAIEDAGFEIRDCVSWLYGSGFPKSHSVALAVDKMNGLGPRAKAFNMKGRGDRADEFDTNGHNILPPYEPVTPEAEQWQGWGTALKPAAELIVLARKPLSEGTVASNVLRWRTGAINVDACRVGDEVRSAAFTSFGPCHGNRLGAADTADERRGTQGDPKDYVGRWPANVCHDGSDEVVAAFPEALGQNGTVSGDEPSATTGNIFSRYEARATTAVPRDAGGSAARFFFQARQDDPCHSTNIASDAADRFDLQSARVVSVLSHVVALTTERLALEPASYRALDTSASASEFALIVASVTELIQNLDRRFALGLSPERLSVRLDRATCAAIRNPIGITTITISLSTSGQCADVATFNIIETSAGVGASDSARRFHYTSKADADDRLGSAHPTVKPVDLMQWLVRLTTPPGGTVLDPFSGTGTTGEAAWREGMRAVLVEAEPEYQADIRRRMALAMSGPDERSRESMKEKQRRTGAPPDYGPLFRGTE
jgi:DNA modification methylase